MHFAPQCILLGSLLLLTACGGSAPTRFYTLAPISAPTAQSQGPELAVGLGPVELPKTMDRTQIVTRTDQNELKLADFDRWAEPIQDNFTQVLAENLALLLPSQRVVVYPWSHARALDYQVTVRVVRFDRTAGGDAVLKARWSILGPAKENELLARESSYTVHPAGEDYHATVAAMNQALNDFSRDVAAAVHGLRK